VGNSTIRVAGAEHCYGSVSGCCRGERVHASFSDEDLWMLADGWLESGEARVGGKVSAGVEVAGSVRAGVEDSELGVLGAPIDEDGQDGSGRAGHSGWSPLPSGSEVGADSVGPKHCLR
jgi:hypothetical protein